MKQAQRLNSVESALIAKSAHEMAAYIAADGKVPADAIGEARKIATALYGNRHAVELYVERCAGHWINMSVSDIGV